MKLSIETLQKIEMKNSTLVIFVSKQPVQQGASEKVKKGKKKVRELDLMQFPGIQLEIAELIKGAIAEKYFSGKAKESILFRSCNLSSAKNVIAIGLGESDSVSNETLRVAGAVAFNQVKASKFKEACFHLPSLLASSKDSEGAAQAFFEGILLAEYTYDDLKMLSEPEKKAEIPTVEKITALVSESSVKGSLKRALETAKVLAECTNFSRRLGDTPGNLMTPEILANQTVKAAQGTDLKVTVWEKEKIKKERMGGLLGVSLGSAVDPRFIIMQYFGAEKSKKPIAFVGKGLTFDSGGISIKPSAQMDEMRYDMCGGANVIGTMLAIAKLGLKINAIGLVPATENMPGPLANKPGDVLTFRNGKTAEVLNTDAEGRLILADALAYASEQKPALIIDAATLTGAIVVALSNIYTGFFTRDAKLRKQIESAAEVSGELLWAMPLHDFHVEDIKGSYSDLSNISSYKGGGSSTAAAFLEQFVESGTPWAHFDIAGTSWACGNRFPYCPSKGASGAMIRTFVELARGY
jgi:leucyl aminopeptidase